MSHRIIRTAAALLACLGLVLGTAAVQGVTSAPSTRAIGGCCSK